jgi:uncharacterized protein YbjQ (UPF0145 family)
MGLFGGNSSSDKQDAKELQEKISRVKITTGDIKQNYEIVKIVFQLGSDQGGAMGSLFGTGGSPEAAFDKAEAQLKLKAFELGCNYVINAVFDHRIAVGKTVSGGGNHVIEVFGYGTAVKTI